MNEAIPVVTIASGVERWAAEGRGRVDLGYVPFPKQQQFHASAAKYRLFGGAAGPGKTKALLMEAILQAHEHPGANTLLLRRTFPELEHRCCCIFGARCRANCTGAFTNRNTW